MGVSLDINKGKSHLFLLKEDQKMKKLLAIVLICILAFGMVGCGDGNDADKVGFAVSTQTNPFFVTLVDGAKAAAEDAGIDLIVTDANDDAATQANNIEDLIAKGVKVLIVNPVDSDAVKAPVQKALDAGIKVIAVDRAVNGATVDCSIASDNVLGAELATKELVKLLGEGAEVIELEGITGASATVDRGKGFHNIADTQLKVVAKQTAKFDRAEGEKVMSNLLQAHPNVKGVFAHNDEMALGALKAIQSAKKDVKVIGFDATDDALKAVEDGTLAATIAQQPDLMGKTAVETAVKLIAGETVEVSIPVEVKLVTK